ncbi:MAG: hypothetical protein MZV64_09940 [Ignavibacteriales bacterium]|nr:hypothetical protein [Ignavibacteriales bacterium]
MERPAFNPAGAAGQNPAVLAASGSREVSWTAEVVGRRGQGRPLLDLPGRTGCPHRVGRARRSRQDRPGRALLLPPQGGRPGGQHGSLGSRGRFGWTPRRRLRRSPPTPGPSAPTGTASRTRSASSPKYAPPTPPPPGRSWSKPAAGGGALRSWKGAGAVPRELPGTERPTQEPRRRTAQYEAALDGAVRQPGRSRGLFRGDRPGYRQRPKAQVSAEPLLFSPNGDGRKDEVVISQSAVPGDEWRGPSWPATARPYAPGPGGALAPVSWDGKDEEGNPVPDGRYSYLLASEDAAGNKAEYRVDGIAADTRAVQAFVTANRAGFSPNGDGRYDDIRFSPIVNLRDGVESWNLAVTERLRRRAEILSARASAPCPGNWSGTERTTRARSPREPSPPGLHRPVRQGGRPPGPDGPFVLDTEGPKVRLRTSPEPSARTTTGWMTSSPWPPP